MGFCRFIVLRVLIVRRNCMIKFENHYFLLEDGIFNFLRTTSDWVDHVRQSEYPLFNCQLPCLFVPRHLDGVLFAGTTRFTAGLCCASVGHARSGTLPHDVCSDAIVLLRERSDPSVANASDSQHPESARPHSGATALPEENSEQNMGIEC